ncbi:MAG TPA: carboxypeptidase regulatory-like domain-containing protein [Acidobacteriota bacterium]|jgi:hypothetical protein|nr:carboxypeptidase regulatory-like domain-containing protein [Acidobacteriota bacterium]
MASAKSSFERKPFFLLCLVQTALVLCFGSAFLPAQEFRGTLLGRVTDQSGASIPGVSVKAINEATNISAAALTADDGAYNIPFLNSGTYRIEAEMPGFKKFVQSGVTVAVGQRATVNIVLQVGEISESTVVTANAPLLESSTGGMGQVIDRKKVESMPLNGRMVFMLNQLAEGVLWQVPTFGATGTSGLRPFDNLGGSAWSINGGRVTTNEFLLDGAPDSTRGRYNFSPPVDAVEEFKVQTNTYDAMYGRTGGGVVNMTLKSGTNQFHGQAWDFVRYGAWDANNTINNATGQARPPHQFNQYGVTATGPIIKDKTFWMFTWEGLRERVPFPISTSVPTAAERIGDFTKSYTDQPTPLLIFDPLTTRSEGGRLVRNPFQGNVIPANRINPIAAKILQAIYPLPNIPNQRLNNYVNPVNKGKYDYNAELTRIDHVFSDKLRMFGSYYQNHRNEFRSNNGLQGTFANQGQWPQTRNNHGMTLDWVYTLNPVSLVNFRTGFTRFIEFFSQSDVKAFDRKPLGFKSLPGQYLPRINLEQFTDIGVGSEGRGTVDNTASVQGNYTRTFARHVMKVGAEYRNVRSNPVTTGDFNGFFNFTRVFTRRDQNSADSTSGNSVASFLLGYPANANIGAGQAQAMQWHYTAFFVQDDFRVSPRLTLNLGFRWDYEAPVTERYNRLVRGFAFDQANPLAEKVKNAPGASECPGCTSLKGGLLFAGVNGVSSGLFDPDRNNFQPRLGFAYSFGDKTVIRGGYGMYYLATTQFGPQTGFFVSTPYIANDINGRPGIPELGINAFDNPFPNGPAVAPGASAGLLTQVGQGLSFDNPGRRVPYFYQYNLSIQRQLARNIILDVAYVGSQTKKLAVGKGINEISSADLAKGAAFLQQVVTNPFAGLLPGSGVNGATVQRQQLLRPYPEFTGITENAMSIGKAWYNSFQMRVEKRMSGGLTFLSSYTLSKNMEQNGFQNAQDTEMVRQLTSFDRTHRWVLSGIYDLPFGSGKRFGKDIPKSLNYIMGGWQIQGIFTQQSGVPLGEPNLERIGSAKLKNSTDDRYFNTCYRDVNGNLVNCMAGEQPVWYQRAPFTLRTTPDRFSDIRNPWKPTLDLSLFKYLKLTERFTLEYHLESFNLTNTVIHPGPNTSFADKNFGKIADPKPSLYFPRNIQMALKLRF